MESNDALVDHLVARGHIHSDRVADAFSSVDRARFVPDSHRTDAYTDRPLPIGADATISAPHMVAASTELLDVQPDSTVLEIGAGSGYQLAVLAHLTDARVVGVELDPALADTARDRLPDTVDVVQGSGIDAVDGTFDRILYSCAIDAIDRGLPALTDDGVLVAPVQTRGHAQALTRHDAATGDTTQHGRVRFVPYRDG